MTSNAEKHISKVKRLSYSNKRRDAVRWSSCTVKKPQLLRRCPHTGLMTGWLTALKATHTLLLWKYVYFNLLLFKKKFPSIIKT